MLAMVVGGQLAAPQHVAQAHGLSPQIGCSGSDCTGQDPQLMGCTTYEQVYAKVGVYGAGGVNIGEVYLMYSGRCGARWGTTVPNDGSARTTSSIKGASDAYSAMCVGYCYSLMVGNQLAYACGRVSGYNACTVQK